MIAALRDWLIDPAVRHRDMDAVDASIAHREGVERKAMLRALFTQFYRDCRAMDDRHFAGAAGLRLEIGSGAGIIKRLYPDVVTSDIKVLPFLDLVLSGDAMPFPNGALRAIYAINVFHHLPDPRRFFREMRRVLHPGGGVVFIEPYHGLAARWLFPRLHASEGFEPDAPSWVSAGQTGPMSNANQALSYVVFTRDRATFESEFPDLEIVVDRPHTHLSYLVSGGVNFRQLLPDAAIPIVRAAERMLAPLDPLLALQHTIVLRKRAAAPRPA